MFSARRRIKSEVGLFFVHKKNGDIRMVVDARRTNALHHRPPPVHLGSVEAFSDIDWSEAVAAHGAAVGRTCAFAEKVLDDFVAECSRVGLLLHEVHRGVLELEALGAVLDCRRHLLLQKPRRVWRAHLAGQALLRRSRASGLELQIWMGHIIHLVGLCRPALSVFQNIYPFIAQFSSRRGRLSPTVRQEIRMASWLVFLAGVDLQSPLASLVHMGDSSTQGYAVMSTRATPREVRHEFRLRERWRFADVADDFQPAVLDASICDEMAGLSPLGGAPDEQDAARLFAPGHVPGRASIRSLRRETEFERWVSARLAARPAPPPVRAARHRAPRCLVLRPASWLTAAPWWDWRGRWRTCFEGRWRHPEEHINVKETRVALMAIMRAARSSEAVGHRHLLFSDNLTTCLVLDRGRSRAYNLNCLCRRACAYALALSCRWRVRYIESERNHADAGSCRVEQHEQSWKLWHRWRLGRWPDSVVLSRRLLVLADLVPPPGLPPSAPWLDWPAIAPSTISSPLRSDVDSSAFLADADRPLVVESSRSSRQHGPALAQARLLRSIFVAELVAIELFAGTARLSAAWAACGLRVGPAFEISSGPRWDLLRSETQQKVLELIRSGRVWYVHFGTPCTIWSISRTTPAPSVKSRAKEVLGITLAIFTAVAAREASRCSVFWSIENPASSIIWGFPPFVSLGALPQVHKVVLHMCAFGEAWKKPTAILCNVPGLASLGLRCPGNHKHIQLSGSTVVQTPGGPRTVSRTALAGAYPFELCRRWADICRTIAPAGALGTGWSWQARFESSLPTARHALDRAALDAHCRSSPSFAGLFRHRPLTDAELEYLSHHRLLAEHRG